MERELLNTLLKLLRLQILAQMVVDLEETAEDWQLYPEEAPPEETQQELEQLRLLITEAGTARAKAERRNFQKMVDEARDEREAEAWLIDRNRQTRENWFKDYE